MSCASEQYFSTSWSISQSSFLGPSRPWNPRQLVPFLCLFFFVANHCPDSSKASFTFFGRKPCLSTCSRTMKKCCNGIWSESSIRPYLNDVSISSFTINFEMFTRLLLSMMTGSRAVKTTGPGSNLKIAIWKTHQRFMTIVRRALYICPRLKIWKIKVPPEGWIWWWELWQPAKRNVKRLESKSCAKKSIKLIQRKRKGWIDAFACWEMIIRGYTEN